MPTQNVNVTDKIASFRLMLGETSSKSWLFPGDVLARNQSGATTIFYSPRSKPLSAIPTC